MPGDGTVVAVVTDDAFDGTSDVRRFSTVDGTEVAPPVPADVHQPCAAAFGSSPSRLVVPTWSDHRAVALAVAGASTRPFTVVEPEVGGRCLVWAAEALDGPPRAAPLVRPEALLLAAGVAGAALVLALRRRRRR